MEKRKKKKSSLWAKIWKYRHFYIIFLPVFVMVLLFYYLPMLGVRYSFYEYTPFKGPNFVGLEQFRKLWSSPSFWKAFRNTIVISITNLALSMLCSVGLALLLNEVGRIHLKRTLQTIVYLPHFVSWVVVASIFMILLSPGQNGMLNAFLVKIGIIENPIYFFAETNWWRLVYYFISRWKETGWGTVIFLASLSGISPELYEAASMDGAGHWKKMFNITLPGIADTFLVVLILNLSKVLNLFESVLVLYNDKVLESADVIQTYVYRLSIINSSPDYGYTTAVGLFTSVVSLVLVVACDQISKKIRGRGII